MRRLIADLYKIAFKITESKIVSLFFSIGYISLLNLLSIYGLGILLEDMLPELSYIHLVFSFPYIIGIVLVMVSFNFWLMLPLHKLSEEFDVKPVLRPIIIYTVISAFLYAYTLLVNHVL